jgi:hypothetical protein
MPRHDISGPSDSNEFEGLFLFVDIDILSVLGYLASILCGLKASIFERNNRPFASGAVTVE